MRTCQALFPDVNGPQNNEDIKDILGNLKETEGLSVVAKTILGVSRRTTSNGVLIDILDKVIKEMDESNALAGNFGDQEDKKFGLQDSEKLLALKRTEIIYKLQLIKNKLHEKTYGVGTSDEEVRTIVSIRKGLDLKLSEKGAEQKETKEERELLELVNKYGVGVMHTSLPAEYSSNRGGGFADFSDPDKTKYNERWSNISGALIIYVDNRKK